MLRPRKHADLIKAWADGHTIQYYFPMSKEWRDINTDDTGPGPAWLEHTDYRLKPDIKKYRLAEFRSISGNTFVSVFEKQERARSAEKTPAFIRWLTEWIEYT